MLDSLTLLRAMNGIHGEDVVMAGKSYFESRKTRNTRKIIRITLLAAVLISLLTVGAYASSFLGLKAIMIPEATIEVSNTPAPTAQSQDISEETGSTAPVSAPEPQETAEQAAGNALVSITQPQAVPEELDSSIKEKVANARAAWDEWQNWRETAAEIPHNPEVFNFPKNTGVRNEEENEDGSYTLSFYDKDTWALIKPDANGAPDYSAAPPTEVRIATADEMAAHKAWMEYQYNAKYGLRLRRGQTLLWSKETTEKMDAEFNAQHGTSLHTDTSDPRFLTDRELCDRISAAGCSGDLFREIPWGFDKVYYFDEGTFCVSYDQELSDGRRVKCYGYNSMYATLSSGREVVSRITDPEQFLVRTHTAPDGTELTILQGEKEAFLYVYLPDSFFEMRIQSDGILSEADVDAVADNLNYGGIGI